MAAKVMRAALEKSKDITFTDFVVTLRSVVNEAAVAELSSLAEEIC